MRRRQLSLTDYGPAPGRLDAAVEWLLTALLLFMPLAFGAVEPWSEFLVVAAALVLAVLLVARRLVRSDYPAGWTWAYVPMGLYVLLAVSQLLALPDSLLKFVSPETVAAKGRLLADLPGAGGAGRAATLSFYTLATRHDLRTVLVAAAIFVGVIEVYRRPEQVRRLLLAVTCVGGVVALIALAQHLLGTDRIYGFVSVPQGVADGGPFINHNHFAQFMNLSVGTAIGLLVVKLRDLRVGVDLPGSEVAAALREPEARAAWFYAAVFVAGVVSVFLSMSRGGMLGMLAGLALVTSALARRQQLRGQGWVVAALTLAAFTGLLYFGFDAVYDRLAAVRNFPEATGGRWEMVKGAMAVWGKYPLLGTGLGTHAYVFPAYDQTGSTNLAQYVENEYVQALEETGAVGLALVLAFVAGVWVNYARAARAERPRVCAAAHGLAFGLAAVMVQSVSDFGQHVPAVAGLSAVTCGLLVVLARLARRAEASRAAAAAALEAPVDAGVGEAGPREPGAGPLEPRAEPAPPRAARGWAGALVPGLAAVVLAWAMMDAHAARVAAADAAEANRVAADLSRAGWDGSDEDYTLLLTRSAAASEARPDDVEYRYWLNAYRWRAIARERDPDTGDLLLTEDALGHTARIVDELHEARALCPTYGPLVSLAGQLEAFVLDRPIGRDHIALAYALAPNHPDVVFTAATAEADRGDWEGSLTRFRRCLDLAPHLVRDVIDVYETQYERPDLAVAAGEHVGDPGALIELAARLRKRPDASNLAAAARAAVVRRLTDRAGRGDAQPWMIGTLAGLHREDGNADAAIKYYRRGLETDYGQVEWRLDLARLLAARGRHAEALKEAQICLRLRPTMEAAKQLVGDLSVVVPATAAPASGPAASR